MTRLPILSGLVPIQRFDADLEAIYQADLEPHKRAAALQGAWLAIALFSTFGLLDVWAIPGSLTEVLAIRFVVVVPLLLAVAWSTGQPFFIRHYRSLMWTMYLGMGLAIQAMIMLAQPVEVAHFAYYAGLILVVIALYNWTFLGPRETAMIGFGLVLLYFLLEVAAHLAAHEKHGFDSLAIVLLANLFFFSSANVIGLLAVLMRERHLRQLFLLKREAETLARVKSEFLASMSHEIRTPLNAVLGFAQIGARDSIGRAAHQTFQRILDSGQLLLGVVNDILDFSKIEAGRLIIEDEAYDLQALLREVLRLFEEQASVRGLTLALDADPALPAHCAGDRLRVAQVLTNLLSNAVKFTREGEVRLGAAQDGDWLVFSVSDTGIGMDAAAQTRLFQPFEQADASITRRFGGTGLGMAISQRLVTLMQGRITLDSATGCGSRFTVRLPFRATKACTEPESALNQPSVAPGSGPRLAGVRLLIAEDNPVNRLLLEDMLVAEGAALSFASHGLEGLEILTERGRAAFDLVLTDIEMPVMDGYALASSLRELAPGLPVIGLTAHAMAEARQHCLEVGMVEHVTKPIDLDRLVESIRRHLPLLPIQAASEAAAPVPVETVAAEVRMELAPEAARPVIDWAALEQRYAGRQDFIDRLLTMLRSHYAESAAKLRAAIAAGQVAELMALAHSLKGMAGNLCAEALQEQARRTEQAARADAEETAELAEGLAQLMDKLISEAGYRR